jgi:hypothetical protein
MTTRTRTTPTRFKALAAVIFAALFFVGLQAPAAQAIPPVDITVNLTTKSGTPLSGVTIYAYPWANHAAKPFGTVIESQPTGVGSYNLEDLDPGQNYALYFDAPGTATTAFDQFYGGTTFIEDATPKSWTTDSDFNVSLATNATITGTVKNTSSKAIAGVTVYPWRFDGSRYYKLWGAATTTNGSGAYALKNLEPGSYFVEFAPDNTLGYIGELSGDKPLPLGSSLLSTPATKLYIGLGASASANATLAKGGAISGTAATLVFSPSNLIAVAYPYDTGSDALDTSRAYFSKITGTSGAWKVSGLPSDTYVVKLYDAQAPPEFVERWVNGTSGGAGDPGSATKFAVTAPGTKTTSSTTLNYLNNPGEDTSVDLTITHSGNPVSDVTTKVYIENADGDDTYYVLDSRNQNPYQLDAGAFHFPFLPAGNYSVWVDPGDPAIQPFIGTKNVSAAAGTDAWNIALPNASAFTFTTAATISPSATVMGTTYHVSQAVTSLEPSADVDYSYIWLRNGIPIFGATSNSYTSRGVDVGSSLQVLVRADSFGFGSIFQSLTAPTPTQGPAAFPTVSPTIAAPANPVSGSVLTANVGTWNATGLTFSYKWTRDASSTPIGVDRTYTATPADAGHTISLQVSATAVGRPTSGAGASGSVAIGSLTSLKNTTKPTVTSTTSGQPAGSRKYTVSAGKWSLPSTTLSYEWRAAGAAISGATTNVLVCTNLNCPPDQVIEVVVRANKLAYAQASVQLLARKATTKPALTTSYAGEVDDVTNGNAMLNSGSIVDAGHVLEAHPPVYNTPGGTLGTLKQTVQWQSSTNGTTWSSISGATSLRYTLSSTLGGKKIRARVLTTYPNLGVYEDLFDAGTLPNAQITASKVTHTGTVYTVTPGTWSSGAGTTFTYQWYGNGGTVNGEVSDNSLPWTLPGPLFVDVIANKSPLAEAHKRVIVLKGTPSPAANPLLDPAVYGDTLQTNAPPFTFDFAANVVNPTYKYQWYSGSTAISGATHATFTPSSSYVGKALKLKITFSSAYYNTTSVTTNAVVLAAHPAPTISASITGSAVTGTKLTATTAGAPSGASFTYAWERSTDGVSGWTKVSTSSTFTPAASDVTKFLRVKVTVKKSGWLSAPTATSPNVQVQLAPFVTNAPVRLSITKSPPVGSQLTVTTGFVTTGVSLSYEWFRNGVSLPGITGPTWTPTASSYGDDVEVHVTATKTGYATQVFVSNAIQVSQAVAPVATTKPVISDTTPQVGQTLTATPGVWNVDGLTFTYQWKINGSNAPNGNLSTFLVPATTGVITVTVSAGKTGWDGGEATSLGTAPVTP